MLLKIPYTNIEIDQISLDLFQNGKNVTRDYEVNGKYVINLLKYNILRDKEWFVKLAYFKLEVPNTDGNVYTKIEFKKFKKFGISKNLDEYIPVLNYPVSIKVNNVIYRMLIRYPRYYISNNGVVYDSKRNVILSNRYSLMVYPTVYIQDQISGQKSLFVHKLVAMAWVRNDDYYNKNVVDHIDNNKKNCYYKNLQWCSPGANITKRYTNSIKDTVITRNIDTGEIKKFININACSKELFNYSIDVQCMPMRYGKIWNGKSGRYEIYKITDFKKWAFECGEVKEYKLELLKNNKHYMYFSTIRELKKHFCIPKKYNTNKTMFTINSRSLDEFTLINLAVYRSSDSNAIYVYDLVSKKLTTHRTVNEAAGYIGCKYITVHNVLKFKRYGKILNNKYICTNDPSVDLTKVIAVRPDNNKKIIKAIGKSDSIKFESVGELKRLINVDYKTIHSYIKNKKLVTINNKKYILNYVCPLTQ